MKTFLGFTTGFLMGIGVGAVGMATITLISPELREFVEKLSDDFTDTW